MSDIQIITDSVARVPAEVARERGIEVTSLFVRHGADEHREADMDVERFYQGIAGMIDDIPTSSQPSQHELESMFEKAAQAGRAVLGVFLSSRLSGTFDGAVRAARTVKSRNLGFECTLVDSASACSDEGFAVLDACDARDAGGTLKDCVAAAVHSVKSSRFLFTPESLAFLKAGGRIGSVSALLGSLVKITPVLTVADGVPVTFAKVRTTKRALDKIVDTLKDDMARCGGLKRIVVHYIGEKAPAAAWARDVIEPLVGREVPVHPASPVIGVHVGPAMGVAYECMEAVAGKLTPDAPELVFSV